MIVWRGRGFLVVIIAVAALILTQMAVDGMNSEGYYSAHSFPQILAGIFAAIPIWFLGKKWNDESDRRHELFFIPMQYWALIVLALVIWVAMSPSPSSPVNSKSTASSADRPAQLRPTEPAPLVAAAVAPSQLSSTAVAQVQTPSQPAPEPPKIKYVYADNVSHQYYPENCRNRPTNAYQISKSVARIQGYTLAPECRE
jgi:hypothetical protein